jgi:hypothetical protein
MVEETKAPVGLSERVDVVVRLYLDSCSGGSWFESRPGLLLS